MDEEKITVVSRKVETDSIKDVGKERSKEMEAENIEKVEKRMKNESTVGTISTSSGTADPDAEPEVELLNFAMKKYCFIPDTLFNEPEDDYGLKKSSGFTKKVSLLPGGPPYNTLSARGQSISAHDVSWKRDTEDAVNLVGEVVAPELMDKNLVRI